MDNFSWILFDDWVKKERLQIPSECCNLAYVQICVQNEQQSKMYERQCSSITWIMRQDFFPANKRCPLLKLNTTVFQAAILLKYYHTFNLHILSLGHFNLPYYTFLYMAWLKLNMKVESTTDHYIYVTHSRASSGICSVMYMQLWQHIVILLEPSWVRGEFPSAGRA